MKNYKSLLSEILAFMLMLSVFSAMPFTTNAYGELPAFTVDSVVAEKGQKNVAVNVSVTNNPGIASAALDIHYNESALTLKNFEYNTVALNGASTVPFSSSANPPCLSMVNGTANVMGDFTFATLYFDIADTASGSYDISLVYDEDNVYDINEKNIAFQTIEGKITVNGTNETVTDPSVTGNTPAFEVECVTAEKGTKNVAVNVYVKNNPGFASAALDIQFDESVLALMDFSYNTEALNGASTVPFNASAKPSCLSAINGTSNITGDFTFATLYFDVSDDVTGEYIISLSYDADNVYDITEKNIAFQVTNGTITINENTHPTDSTDNPSIPTESTDKPTNPTDPTDSSTNPTDPTDKPTNPTDSTNKPTNPTDPTGSPTNPTDSTDKPTNPTDPTGSPTNPTDSTDKPTNPTDPIESTQPTESQSTKHNISKWVVEGVKNKAYTGKKITLKLLVSDGKGDYADFTTRYLNNIKVGKATVIITGTGDYTGTITKSFKITKAKNPMVVTTKTIKARTNKDTSFTKNKTFIIKKAHGKVTFKKVSGNKKITITKSGKITVKKKLKKKKTYSIKVQVKASGTKYYKSIAKTVNVKIKT